MRLLRWLGLPISLRGDFMKSTDLIPEDQQIKITMPAHVVGSLTLRGLLSYLSSRILTVEKLEAMFGEGCNPKVLSVLYMAIAHFLAATNIDPCTDEREMVLIYHKQHILDQVAKLERETELYIAFRDARTQELADEQKAIHAAKLESSDGLDK